MVWEKYHTYSFYCLKCKKEIEFNCSTCGFAFDTEEIVENEEREKLRSQGKFYDYSFHCLKCEEKMVSIPYYYSPENYYSIYKCPKCNHQIRVSYRKGIIY